MLYHFDLSQKAEKSIVSRGIRLDDEAVRVETGLRLGLEICAPYQCHCEAQVDAYGRHGLVCKKAPGRSIRYHALNDLVARALLAADIPSSKEPQGLCRSDGKRPDGLTLIPWQSGKSLVWDVTLSVIWQTPMSPQLPDKLVQ